MTNRKIFPKPTPTALAFDQLDAWLSAPTVAALGEGAMHIRQLRALSIPAKIAGARFHDARIAAICEAHRVQKLWTADRDFSRFPAIKTHNPLI